MKPKLSRPVFRIVLFSVIAVAVTIMVFLLTLPSIVSTDWFRGVILDAANKSMNRPVDIAKVKWRWTSGITISGITVGNDPSLADSPMFFLETASLRINIGKILSGRIGMDFSADNINVFIIQDQDGATNLDTLFPESEPDDVENDRTGKEIPQDKDTLDISFSLPVDIQFDLKLGNISFLFENRRDNQNISLKYGTVMLSMPSMFFKPVDIRFSGDLQLNDGAPLPVYFNALIENKGSDEKKYILADTSLRINGDMPGIKLMLAGNLSDKGVKGSVDLDLAPITQIMTPFLPEDLSPSQFSGNIALTLEAAMISDQEMTFDTRLTADRITVSGAIIQNRKMEPLNTSLMVKGNFALNTGDLKIQQGVLKLLSNSQVAFGGSVNGLAGQAPEADLMLGPVSVDLAELHDFIKPFLPDDLPVQYEFNNARPVFKMDGIRYRGNPMTGFGQVNLVDMVLSLPGIKLVSNDTAISISNLALAIPAIEAELKQYVPVQAGVAVKLGVDQIDMTGPSPIHLNKLEISDVSINATDIEMDPEALFGVSGVIHLNQSIKLAGMDMPDLLTISNVSYTLDAGCRLLKEKKAELQDNKLTVSISKITINQPSTGKIETSADMRLSLPIISVKNTDPFGADIHDADLRVVLGDLVRLNMTANAKNSAASGADAKGRILVDLGNLPQYLPGNLFEALDLSGTCDLKWDIQGRMPTSREMDRLLSKNIPDLKTDLTFIDHIDMVIDLTPASLDMKLSEKERVRIGGLSATPLVHYAFKNGTGALNTRIKMDKIRQIPGIEFDTPVSVDVVISAAHDGLDTLTLTQETRSNELNLKETFAATISGITGVLADNTQDPIPALLKTAGADIRGNIQVTDFSVLNRFQDDMTVKGALDLDVSMLLVPGESVSAGAALGVHHVFADMENLVSLSDLHGNINLNKTYHIDTYQPSELQAPEPGSPSEATLLSLRVMRTARNRQYSEQAGLVYRPESIVDTQYRPDRTLTFSSVKSDAGPMPVDLSGFVAEVGLNKGLPELKRFQLDLLHGTIAGAVTVFQRNNDFFSYQDINFTGIDLAAFFPKQKTKNKKQDTEVGGRMTLILPISTKLDTFLENVYMDVFFNHIGSRALERLFFAIDPYESNEAIVTQRSILKTGSPKYVRVEIKEGHLSMEGEISLKGAKMEPIDIEPINITNLSGFKTFEGILDGLVPVIEMLRIASSGTILVGQESGFEFR